MNKHTIFFLAGIFLGILACNIVYLSTSNPVYADATAGQSNGLIAVTGLCANGYSGLWVLDTKDTKTSPSVVLYIPESGGKGLRMAAARRIKWDLMLLSYNDATRKGYTPSELKEEVEKINKKEEEKSQKK